VAMNLHHRRLFGQKGDLQGAFPCLDGRCTFPAPKFPCDTSSSRNTSNLRASGHQRRFHREGVGLDGVRQFYSVPAQSASLYPKLAISERRAASARCSTLRRSAGAFCVDEMELAGRQEIRVTHQAFDSGRMR